MDLKDPSPEGDDGGEPPALPLAFFSCFEYDKEQESSKKSAGAARETGRLPIS